MYLAMIVNSIISNLETPIPMVIAIGLTNHSLAIIEIKLLLVESSYSQGSLDMVKFDHWVNHPI